MCWLWSFLQIEAVSALEGEYVLWSHMQKSAEQLRCLKTPWGHLANEFNLEWRKQVQSFFVHVCLLDLFPSLHPFGMFPSVFWSNACTSWHLRKTQLVSFHRDMYGSSLILQGRFESDSEYTYLIGIGPYKCRVCCRSVLKMDFLSCYLSSFFDKRCADVSSERENALCIMIMSDFVRALERKQAVVLWI